jgi:hypothetical protein
VNPHLAKRRLPVTLLLTALTVFNFCAGFAALKRAFRLVTAEGRARWASRRLYGIAVFVAWTLPIIALFASVWAWRLAQGLAAHFAAPMMFAPIGWIIIWGILFAIVDVAEDGVLDFGRGPKRGGSQTGA